MADQTKRIEWSYFEGVNALTARNLAKRNELSHAENARVVSVGAIEKRAGQTQEGTLSVVRNHGVFDFHGTAKDFSATLTGLYRVSSPTVDTSATVYGQTAAGAWQALAGSGAGIATTSAVDPSMDMSTFSGAVAEGCLFLTNFSDVPRYVKEDGLTVVTSASVTGHLYGCPNASLFAYYKGCLYAADYVRDVSGVKTRFRNCFLKSSRPLGMIGFVTDDPVSARPTAIGVGDSRYYRAGGQVDIYRGPSKIGTYTISKVNETDIELSVSVLGTVRASDQIWAVGTYDGPQRFLWPQAPAVHGTNTKDPDSWRLAGGDEGPIRMLATVGNVLMVANDDNIAAWNEYLLQAFDSGIGCVSRNGYVKLLGKLYFIHHSGIFATGGGEPVLISQKVERYIRGATKAGKAACAAGKKGRSVFFTIGDVTLYNPDGSEDKTLSSVCLEYNVTQEQWFVHTDVSAKMFATFVDSDDTDRLMEASEVLPSRPIAEFLSGNTDFGNPIHFRIDTNDTYVNDRMEAFGYPRQIVTESERGTMAEGFMSVDQGRFYPVDGNIVKGASVLRVPGQGPDRSRPPKARSMKVSIRDSSAQSCRFTRVAVDVDVTDRSDTESVTEKE